MISAKSICYLFFKSYIISRISAILDCEDYDFIMSVPNRRLKNTQRKFFEHIHAIILSNLNFVNSNQGKRNRRWPKCKT